MQSLKERQVSYRGNSAKDGESLPVQCQSPSEEFPGCRHIGFRALRKPLSLLAETEPDQQYNQADGGCIADFEQLQLHRLQVDTLAA